MIHLISVDCWWRCTHSSHSQTSINSQGEQCGRTSSRFVLHFGLILLFSGHRLTLKNINNKFIVSIDEKAGQCKWLPTAVCFSSITTNVLQHGSILDPEDRRLYPVNCKISKHLKDIWTSLEKKKKEKRKKNHFCLSLFRNQDSGESKLSRGDAGRFTGRVGRTCSFRWTYFLHRSQ